MILYLNLSVILSVINLCSGILLNRPNVDIVKFKNSCTAKCNAEARQATKCSVPLPRHYVTHHLNGDVITVDGKLDEDAWKKVPWTENFVDIRGIGFKAPPVDTKVKVRWDDKFVYVGAYMEEPHVWATYTHNDSRVYQENAFEVFFDVDASMSMYKEIEINALGTTWDLIMSRAYMDGGDWKDWEGIAKKAVYTDGVVNDATVKSTFWSVEIAFPFTMLSENTSRHQGAGREGEMWFMELARPRYTLQSTANHTYEKVPGTDASWYAWSPTGAINLHIPSRWGLLYFSKTSPSHPHDPVSTSWTTYSALFDVFNALKTFKAVQGTYTDDFTVLNLLPYVTSSSCMTSLEISLEGDGFMVTIRNTKDSNVKGHINQDRHVWFTSV